MQRSGSTSAITRLAVILSALVVALASAVGGCKSVESNSANKDTKTPSTPMSTKTPAAAGITQSSFGKTASGQSVDLYTLTNGNGLVAKITNYGGIITELHVPDRAGKTADVVLGFGSLDKYLAGHPFFGALAGRYANRIAKGTFTLDGKEFSLFVNNGPNSLHGGKEGFDKKLWKAEQVSGADGPSLKLTYVSADGEEGYPAKLTTTCTYTLTKDNALKIVFDATTDKPTVLNLTNHSYFNLGGENSGTILDLELTLNCDKFTPTDDVQIPTGELKDVKGTPMDFTSLHKIGQRIEQVNKPPSQGYDHNFVINGGGKDKLVMAAKLKDPKSGRAMECWTTQPGVQLYTGNFLDGSLTGIGGTKYVKNTGVCLETQHFPDSPNHPDFPTTTLKPGEKYHQVTVYKFSAE
jgi:aldose 1-epimerase